MTGEVRGSNIRDLIVRLIQYEASRFPLLIVLEDLHLLDTASWTLLRDVSKKVNPTLVCVDTRPFSIPVPVQFQELVNRSETKLLRLEVMPLDEVEDLVCQRLRVQSIPEQVSNFNRERSEGHPFFAEELAYTLRDAGVLLIEGNQCSLAPEFDNLKAVMLPENLQAVITSRIDGLNLSEQLTLKVASVIGRTFAYRMLQAIYFIENDCSTLPSYMETLTRRCVSWIGKTGPG